MANITLSLDEEFTARFDRLDRALAVLQLQLEELLTKQKAPAPSTSEPVAPPAPTTVVPELAPAPFVITRDDVRKQVVAISAAGKTAKVREIVKAYASSVTELPEDKLAEVYEKLAAIKEDNTDG